MQLLLFFNSPMPLVARVQQVFMLWNIPSRLSFFFFFFFFFPAIHVNLFLFLRLQTGRGYVAGSAVKLLSQATATSTQGWHTDGWRWRGAVRRPRAPCCCRRDLWTSFVFFCGETNGRESYGGTKLDKKPRNSRAEKIETLCVCVCNQLCNMGVGCHGVLPYSLSWHRDNLKLLFVFALPCY